MAISAKLVNELRQKTGAGIMDCKRALTETDGDIDKAITYLREKGMASAAKKSARVAAEGKVDAMVQADGRIGAMAEINCETDFVARGEDFQNFCRRVIEVMLDASAEQLERQDLFEATRKELVAKTGENVVVRRHVRFGLPDDVVGRIESYLHMGGKIGVMIEVGCESDRVAEGEELAELCRELTMHVAAASPLYLHRDEVPARVIEAEKNIYRKQALDTGKPEKVAEKMVEGRLNKWYGEFCLLDQPWVREPKKTIEQLRKEVASKTGEKVVIRRSARYQLGEGIEKKQSDLAEEVKAQVEASKQG